VPPVFHRSLLSKRIEAQYNFFWRYNVVRYIVLRMTTGTSWFKSVLSAGVIAAACATVLTQSRGALKFDVASVKANADGGMDTRGLGTIRTTLGGRLEAQKAQLRYIIQNAYRLRRFQVLGGPDWINSAHYDIEAKAENNPSPQQLWMMLQSLLAERFKLRVRQETRELPIYQLAVAKGGVRLRPPAADGCVARGSGGAAPAPPPRAGQSVIAACGTIIAMGGTAGMRMDGGKVVMAELVRVLSSMLDRPVVDGTGVTSSFDIHLQFNFDQALAGLATDPNHPPFAAEPAGPSIFTALQEQLGLRLESAKGPVEVIVIDHVERPGGN
jgi:uncharacterized protein (TIGR03435 family)